ncbi:MAG: CaiB/BaiF CoA transferase family protein, partial [Hyphomonadaceae bacterium]
IVRRLVESADVFLQNSRPGGMERLGLGYDDLRGINPRLIYVSISGFGENGPFARRAAYDGVIQGLTGFLPIQGGEAGPQAVRCPVADKVTAMWASNATLAALLHRAQNGGQGQKVLVNMTAAYSAFMLLDAMQNHTFLSQEHEPVTLSYDVYRTLRTGDGEVIGLVLQPAQLKGFCEALGRTDLLSDPRFSDSVLLVRNARALYEAVAAEVRQLSTAEFLERMADKSVPFARVNTIDEFLGSDEAKYSGAYIDFEDPELGVVRNLNYPAQFERTPTQAGRRAPKLGEHNKEILGALEKK